MKNIIQKFLNQNSIFIAIILSFNTCKKENENIINQKTNQKIIYNALSSGKDKKDIKHEWSKSLLKNQAYIHTLKIWYIVNASKGSLGSWLGESAHSGKEVKDNIKNALDEFRVYENGKYKIKEKVNWSKIKSKIDKANEKIKNINGPLTFVLGNWNSAKIRIPKLKAFVNNFYNYHVINKNNFNNKDYDTYLNKIIKNNIHNTFSFIKEFMPYILIGKTSRSKKKEIKKNINEAFLHLEKNEWKLVRLKLKKSKEACSFIIEDANITTKIIGNITRDYLQEKLNSAYTLVNEYINLYLSL